MGAKKSKKESKTYVITSAQCGVRPNWNFLKGLETYSKNKDGELRILIMPGKGLRDDELHEGLKNRDDVFTRKKIKLNENIFLSDIIVPPQNKDPSTGQGEYITNDATSIIAHTKQRWKAFPNSNYELPRLFISTGAVTEPNYRKNNDRGNKAQKDHIYGAIVVEVIDNKLFHVRNIRAQVNGKFVDLCMQYDGNKKPKKVSLEALVLGDLHVGDIDPEVMDTNYEIINQLKPRRVIIHDLFNGYSVNHHNAKKIITQVRELYNKGKASLRDELMECYEELCKLSDAIGKDGEVVISASNHDEWLERYLEECRYTTDPLNLRIASELISPTIDGENPLEIGIKKIGKVPDNIKFLTRTQDYKVWGVQLASHGDKGAHGGRGTITSRISAHGGKSITGHSHVPEIKGGTYVVGTSTYLNLPYTKGDSSAWMNTNALLYDGGATQLVNVIRGKWRRE